MGGLLVFSNLSTGKSGQVLAAAESSDVLEEVKSIDEKEFQKVVESGTTEQLGNVLQSLNNWKQEENQGVDEKVKKNQRRVDIANKMMTMELDSEQRALAVRSKIDALEAIYGLTFLADGESLPSVYQDLKNCATDYKSDEDPSLSRQARIGLMKVECFETSREDNPDLDLVANEMCKVMKSYPDDDAALATVDSIVEFYRLKLGEESSSKIGSRLVSRRDEFTSPKVLAMLYDFSDEAKLAKTKYVQLFENRWVNGERGQQELLKRSIELVSDHDPGRRVISRVNLVALWFEQAGMYESSKQIYESVLKAVDRYKSPDVAVVAKKIAYDGLARQRLIGRKLDFNCYQFDGRPLQKSVVEDRVVVVAFWSTYNSESKGTIASLLPRAIRWKDRGVRVLAVNVDGEKEHIDKSFIATMEDLVFIYNDPDNGYSNKILSQCPSDQVPRIMLVRKDGVVSDINVPLSELDTEVEFLIRE